MATTTKTTDGLFAVFVAAARLRRSSKKGHDSDTLKFEVKSSMLLPWSCSLAGIGCCVDVDGAVSLGEYTHNIL